MVKLRKKKWLGWLSRMVVKFMGRKRMKSKPEDSTASSIVDALCPRHEVNDSK